MAPKKTCPSFLADGVTLCGKDAKFPEDNPIVCGNHKYKIIGGVFDQTATKVPANKRKKMERFERQAAQSNPTGSGPRSPAAMTGKGKRQKK